MSTRAVVAARPRPLPGPPRAAAFRLLPQMVRSRLGVMQYAVARYGDAVRLPLGPKTLNVFNHPEYAKHVLADNAANYTKGIGEIHARRVMGDGLLTSEGDRWRRQRKNMQPLFNARRLAAQVEVMSSEAEKLVGRLREHRGEGPLDIRGEMTGLALGVLGRTLIDADLGGFETMAQAFEVVQDQALFEVMSLGTVPLWLPLPQQLRFHRAKRSLQAMVDQLAADGATRENSDDIISRLLESVRDEADPRVGRAQMRDELVTLLLAGHETTATTMSWAFYLLDAHPEWWQRLHDEAVEVFSRGPLTAESLHGLRDTGLVIMETLRLYPPVWLLPRISKQPDVIGGYAVPAGADVLICPFLLHRHPGFWSDPERFDPERFDPARHVDRERYAYLPFGAGPRFCIGNNLGTMEATIVLATVARDLRLRLAPGHQVSYEPMLTLRVRGGLPMTVHELG